MWDLFTIPAPKKKTSDTIAAQCFAIRDLNSREIGGLLKLKTFAWLAKSGEH